MSTLGFASLQACIRDAKHYRGCWTALR